MVQFKNIEVTVIRYDDKKPYTEHKLTPDATKQPQTVKEAYVEVVTGERFAVVVEVLPAFRFQSLPHVQILLAVDGMKSQNFYISRENVLNSRTAAASMSRKKVWEEDTRGIDGKWMKCALVFADLQLDEDADPTTDRITHQVDTRGKITVEVRLGTRECLPPRPWTGVKPSEKTSASKDVVKKNHISSAVKMVELEESLAPVTNTLFKPVKGVNTQPVRFNLLYRTRSALELPKIIPTSTVAPYPLSSPSTASGHGGGGTTERTAAKSPLNGDNDTEQPPPKKIKKETGAEDENLRVRPECKRSQPEIKSRIQYALDSDNASASNTPLPHSNPQPSLDQNSARSSPIVIRDDDDEVLVANVSMVPVPHGDQAKRERKKEILKNRLEQLKIKQELVEMED